MVLFSFLEVVGLAANGSLLAAVAGLAFRQLKCREKDEKRDTAEWLDVSRYGSKHVLGALFLV